MLRITAQEVCRIVFIPKILFTHICIVSYPDQTVSLQYNITHVLRATRSGGDAKVDTTNIFLLHVTRAGKELLKITTIHRIFLACNLSVNACEVNAGRLPD